MENAQTKPENRCLAGADGCKAGWVVALARGWPLTEPPKLVIVPSFAALLTLTRSCAAVVVDMPIGLLSGPGHRECDRAAREMLKAGAWSRPAGPPVKSPASRVFPPPVRQALTVEDYRQALALNRATCGKGIPAQAWGLSAKLRDIHAVFDADPGLQQRVMEGHPEAAFTRLAGCTLRPKKTPEGRDERLRALTLEHPLLAQAHGLDRLPGSAMDDRLDALAMLVAAAHAAAWLAGEAPACRLPGDCEPPLDDKGLRMEIWY
jgi:predicted RNase H-like nuclease